MELRSRSNGIKPKQDNSYERSLIAYIIPKEDLDLTQFFQELMRKQVKEITDKHYTVSRPWPQDRWRHEEVRITFKDFWTKRNFVKSLPGGWNGDLEHAHRSPTISVKFKRQLYTVRFRHDLSDEMNNVLGKLLILKESFNLLRITSLGSAAPVVVQRKHNLWAMTSEKSVSSLENILKNMEKKGEQETMNNSSRPPVVNL